MKKKISQFLGWIVGGISLYVFLWYFFDLEKSKLILTQTRFDLISLATFVLIFSQSLRSLKWTYILRCQESISWLNGCCATMVSALTNFILPVRFGEVLRLFIAKRSSNVSYAASTAASLVDIFSFMFFILLFLFLTPVSGLKLPPWASKFTPVFFVFLAISIFVFVFGVRYSEHCKRWARNLLLLFGIQPDKADILLNGKIVNFFKDTLKQCHISAFGKLDIVIILLLSLMTICADGLSFYFLIKAFGLHITYFKTIMAACFLNVLFFIPSPPGRVGTAEIYFILIFSGIFNLPTSIISTTSVLWHLVGAVIMIIMGILSMIPLGLQLKTILTFSPDTELEVES